MKPRQFALVKYNWDSFPIEWRERNENKFEGFVFCYLGDIPNMQGHSYVQDINTGLGYIFHPSSLIELTEEEV
jgi:hypothetical protein